MLVSSKVIADSGIKFGTSGARGLVKQFTPDVCTAFVYAFIERLKSEFEFESVAVAIDNRPSSSLMAEATVSAIESMGLTAIYYGVIPTPALAFSAMQDSLPSIMITGSHIPFDRNGIKFYRPDGEITKTDEKAILNAQITFDVSKLSSLNTSHRAAEQYVSRYTKLFDQDFLKGKRIGIYEHSSAGRDLYQGLFKSLGAEVISLERTDEFVPIDTEAVDEVDIRKAKTWSKEHNLDFIFSTDGDGDRPLVADENGDWLRGDILGLLCAEAMNIEALALPVSCNTVIDKSPHLKVVKRTKIGSPYVIEALNELLNNYRTVAGFEANGGFLLGSDTKVNGNTLKALPTRDAVLPALMLLFAAKNTEIAKLVKALESRFTHSDRIQGFETERSLVLITNALRQKQRLINELGLKDNTVITADMTDGLRITLDNEDIIHLRPSGNAPELRCYAESTTVDRAKLLVKLVLSKVQLIDASSW